jgi:hypothetical protein
VFVYFEAQLGRAVERNRLGLDFWADAAILR